MFTINWVDKLQRSFVRFDSFCHIIQVQDLANLITMMMEDAPWTRSEGSRSEVEVERAEWLDGSKKTFVFCRHFFFLVKLYFLGLT